MCMFVGTKMYHFSREWSCSIWFWPWIQGAENILCKCLKSQNVFERQRYTGYVKLKFVWNSFEIRSKFVRTSFEIRSKFVRLENLRFDWFKKGKNIRKIWWKSIWIRFVRYSSNYRVESNFQKLDSFEKSWIWFKNL